MTPTSGGQDVDAAWPRVDAERLRAFVAALLERLDLRKQDARVVADVLVEADLRGIESHGVAALVSHAGYARHLRTGRIKAQPEVRLVADRPGLSVFDGDDGLGMIVGRRAMEHAITRAGQVGVHLAVVRHSRHFGIAGYYAMLALERGMIGLAGTNASPRVVPTFGRVPLYGTNPIAFAAPAGEQEPFLLDMATSAVASGKIVVAARHRTPIPEGWAADAEGRPTTDLEAVLKARRLLPLGSRPELSSYKGYGLAVMVEILSAVLAGGPVMPDESEPRRAHWFMAIDIGQAIDPAEFAALMDEMLHRLKTSAPAPGHERVLVAGERELAHRREALARGVPLHPEVAAGLRALATELSVPVPF